MNHTVIRPRKQLSLALYSFLKGRDCIEIKLGTAVL